MNVPDFGNGVRSQAIGMIAGGLMQKEVALRLEVRERSVRRWWHNHKTGASMETKPRSGRPKKLNRIAKVMINKSLGKQRQSTRKISQRLKNKGYNVSKSTVHRHLSENPGAHPYKRSKVPQITDRIRENRLGFALEHKDWIFEVWKKVLWSDESPFELFAKPNRQNDRILARNSDSIKPVIQVKFQRKSWSGA